jgi:hypothetical protein
MSLDPSNLTVKKAIAKLAGLSDEELDALYDAELDGKGRKSLLDAITSARDDIREEATAEEEVAPPAPAVEPPAPAPAPVEEIGMEAFMRLASHERGGWAHVGQGRFVKVG